MYKKLTQNICKHGHYTIGFYVLRQIFDCLNKDLCKFSADYVSFRDSCLHLANMPGLLRILHLNIPTVSKVEKNL